MTFTSTARQLGICSCLSVVFLAVGYAIILAVGLLALTTPQQPIGDPLFAILELLIMFIAPSMVVVMVAVHAWAPMETKPYSLVALVFISLCVGITLSIHFVILTVGHQITATHSPYLSSLLSFNWPSVAYALDIVAWDLLFGLAMLFAAVVFKGGGLNAAIRTLLIISGGLALAGISGAMVGDMQLRMIGVIGYSGFFPCAALLLAILFGRTKPTE